MAPCRGVPHPPPSTEEPPREWHISRFLQHPEHEPFALIVLNGRRLQGTPALEQLWRSAAYKVAADGGANEVCRLNQEKHSYPLDAIVGDLDSITPASRDFFASLDPPTALDHDPDQYSTDLDKSIRWIRRRTSGMNIAILGGLEGRLDQGISQLHHLFVHQRTQGAVYLLSRSSLSFVLKAGRHKVFVRMPTGEEDGEARREVFLKDMGILPLKEPSRTTTRGLEWDVTDWPTEMGGVVSTSNHVLPETEVVEVQTTKDVIFTIALSEEF